MPFERDEVAALLYAHMSEPPPSLSSRRPGLPGAADEVLARALAKAPEKRYGTCLEFAGALRAALDRTPSLAAAPADQGELADSRTRSYTEPLAPRPRRGFRSTIKAWTPRRRLAALALGCVVLAAAAVVPFVLTNLPKSPDHANSPGPTTSPGPAHSGSLAISQSWSRAGLDLPSPYSGEVVASLAFSPSGATLAIADNYLCLWSVPATGCTTDSRFTLANSVAFGADGKILAVGNVTGGTVLWNVATRKPAATFTNPGSKSVESVAFSPDGKTLAVGDFNGRTYLWNVTTGRLAATLTDPGGKGVNSVGFSPDGKLVAAGDFNGSTYLWNVATADLAATLTDPGGKGVDSVRFSPGGQALAAGDSDGSTYLWTVATGRLAGTLPDPSFKGVLSVAFSPDGQTLAAGDGDGSTYLWNVATADLAATLTDPDSLDVNSVAFSPDGKTLATGDYSGTVYLWHKS